MMNRLLLWLGTCAALIFQGSPLAGSFENNKAQVLTMLRAEQYAQLDREMNGIQQAYERGAIIDEQLLAAFRAFYATDRTLEPKFGEWVAKFPKSYSARLARGIHYKYLGFERRGDKFIDKTSDEQLAGMDVYLKMAIEDLLDSSKLTEKPILSYLHAMDIGKNYGLREMNHRLLELANRKAPGNFIVRRKYLYTLQTRWGGSISEMSNFVRECKSAGLPTARMRELDAAITADIAWNLEGLKDYGGAQILYEEALKMVPGDADILTRISWVLVRQAKYSEAVPHLSKLLETKPNDAYALANRAICYTHLKKTDDAFKDYKKAAELGDAISQNELGKFYLHGVIVPRDRQVAIQWFRRAAQQGNDAAKQNLSALASAP